MLFSIIRLEFLDSLTRVTDIERYFLISDKVLRRNSSDVQTTELEMIAFKADEDPRKMHPNMITHEVQNNNDNTGTSSRRFTRDKNVERGRPPML